MKKFVLFFGYLILLLLFASSCSTSPKEDPNSLDLSGSWYFMIDSSNLGLQEAWYKKQLSDVIQLPGSMNTNGKGNEVDVNTPWTGNMWNRDWYDKDNYAKYREKDQVKIVFWLQPDKHYVGPAWYQKEINIPNDWQNKQVVLSLERCHWETTVWIDESPAGSENSLATPHRYALNNLSPGKHRLTIRIDNQVRDINPGLDAHSISDNTQSNWNGMVGQLKLEARPLNYIHSVRIIPNPNNKEIQAEVHIKNNGKKGKGVISLQVSNEQGRLQVMKIDVDLNNKELVKTISYPISHPKYWDEFEANLYTLNTELITEAGEDKRSDIFGMRSISTNGTQIEINEQARFIRGTLECCIFPKTGYPPTDLESWIRIIKICKSYGLNTIRFHSWCPPEAAFLAADRLGFYFQVECGAWSYILGEGTPLDAFLMDESERIVEEYGNHPSFCLLLYGNEPGGPKHVSWLTQFVKHWKAKDNRFLVSTAAGWPIIEENDFNNVPEPRIQAWEDGNKSIINSQVPGSDYDWTDRISKTKPTISHEIGQWCVYPNLKERSKYTGAFKAKNFDIFEDRLKENGLLHLADSFLMASGKLQVLCYKADIEAALRTPGFGGFELLDLHDFPGQGSAIVGVLDPFWDSKPYVSAEEYSRFNNSLVPLARMKRFTYTSGDTIQAKVQVAQYLQANRNNSKVKWSIKDSQGNLEKSGLFIANLVAGSLNDVGEIVCNIHTEVPKQYELSIEVDHHSNAWNIWVYPNKAISNKEVIVSSQLDPSSIAALQNGQKVLLIPKQGSMMNQGRDSVEVGFSSIFWNTLWTNKQAPHTLGILCNPKHPALALFPTSYYSDYQWQYAMSHCSAIPMHLLGKNISPLVRIIDDWFTARSLGMIVELKVGKGKLLICSADLNTKNIQRPEARQLKNSLITYMQSDDFQPSQESSIQQIQSLFIKKNK